MKFTPIDFGGIDRPNLLAIDYDTKMFYTIHKSAYQNFPELFARKIDVYNEPHYVGVEPCMTIDHVKGREPKIVYAKVTQELSFDPYTVVWNGMEVVYHLGFHRGVVYLLNKE